MYGVPKYNEIDPSLFIAITYVIIFGIMFADLGQGICVSIVGALMWKLKKMKIGKILMPCGISSAIFGCVFGSVFGFEHVLDPLYKALFGLDEKPIEVMSSNSIVMILLAAVSIGITLVVVAMGLNIYSSFKQGDVGKLCSDQAVVQVLYSTVQLFSVLQDSLCSVFRYSHLHTFFALSFSPICLSSLASLSDFLLQEKKTGSPKAGADIFLNMPSSQSNFCLNMLQTR